MPTFTAYFSGLFATLPQIFPVIMLYHGKFAIEIKDK